MQGMAVRSLVLALVLFLLAPDPAATQDATPSSGFPGLIGASQRSYRRGEAQLLGTQIFSFLVLRFDSSDSAEEAMGLVPSRLPIGRDLGSLQPTSAPRLGDDSAGYSGTDESGNVSVDIGLLVIRVDRDVHAWLAVGFAGNPFRDLVAVADRWADDLPDSSTNTDDSDLPSLLPALSALPAGFVLREEDSIGVAASPSP